MGRCSEVSRKQKASELSASTGSQSQGSYQLVYIYAKAGQVNEARSMLEKLEIGTDRRNDQLYFQALAHAALGDRERAFVLIEELYKTRSLDLLGLKGDPAWNDLRGDPHFRDLLQRLGLTP